MIGKKDCTPAGATEPMGISFTEGEGPFTTKISPSKSIELNCDDIEKKLKEIEERLGDYRLQQTSTSRQNREDKSTMVSSRIYDTRSILEHPPSPVRTISGSASSNNSTATMSLTYSGEMSETSKKLWDMHHSTENKTGIPQISDTFSIEISDKNDDDDDDDDSIPLLKKEGKEQEERDEFSSSSSGTEQTGKNKVVTLPKTAAPILVEDKPQLDNRSSDKPTKKDQQEVEENDPASQPKNSTETDTQVEGIETVELEVSSPSRLKEAGATITAAKDPTFKTQVKESELELQDVVTHEDEQSLLPQRALFDGLLEVKLSQEDRIRMYTSGSVDDESDPPSVVLSSHGSVPDENNQEDQYDTVSDDQLESLLIENSDNNVDGTNHQAEDIVVENTITTTETCSPCKEWFSIFFGENDKEQSTVVSNTDLNPSIEANTIASNSGNDSLAIEQPKEQSEEQPKDVLQTTETENTIVKMMPIEALETEEMKKETVVEKDTPSTSEKDNEDNILDLSDSFSIDGPLPNSFDSGEEETYAEEGETEQTMDDLCMLKETFVQPTRKINDIPMQATITNNKTSFPTETMSSIANFSSVDVGLVEFEPWDDNVWNIPSTKSSGNINIIEAHAVTSSLIESSRPETKSSISSGINKQTTFLPPPPEDKWNAWLEEKNTMKQAASMHSTKSTEFSRSLTSKKMIPLSPTPRSVPLMSSKNLDECKFDHDDFPTIESFPSDEGGVLYKKNRDDISPLSKQVFSAPILPFKSFKTVIDVTDHYRLTRRILPTTSIVLDFSGQSHTCRTFVPMQEEGKEEQLFWDPLQFTLQPTAGDDMDESPQNKDQLLQPIADVTSPSSINNQFNRNLQESKLNIISSHQDKLGSHASAPGNSPVIGSDPTGGKVSLINNIWHVSKIVLHICGYLCDPVMICRVKILNKSCHDIITMNENSLMQASIRLGRISSNNRPHLWMRMILDSWTSHSNDIGDLKFIELEQKGRESQWNHVIERDVSRAFGNMPPHKTCGRLRTDSIVRILLSMKRKKKKKMNHPTHPLEENDNDAASTVSSTITTIESILTDVTEDGTVETRKDDDFVLDLGILPSPEKMKLQKKLSRILNALAAAHTDIGYCQGMDYVVIHLMKVLSNSIILGGRGNHDSFGDPDKTCVEYVVFRVMNSLLTTYDLRHLYWPELRTLKIFCRVFEKLIERKLPVLADHFDHYEFRVGLFVLGWFQTLFLYIPSMPSSTLNHMWDIWLVERSLKIFFRVGTAILFLSQAALLNQDLEGMMMYFNTFPDSSILRHDVLIPCALRIKITNRMLHEIEKKVLWEHEAAHGIR